MSEKKQYETTKDDITDIFKTVGMSYGYARENIEVDFRRFSDFKVRWERSYTWVNFHIGYQMQYAPVWFITEIAHRFFASFKGEKLEMSENAKSWVDCNKWKWHKGIVPEEITE